MRLKSTNDGNPEKHPLALVGKAGVENLGVKGPADVSMPEWAKQNQFQKVVRNAAYNSWGWVITVLISLVATPYIIQNLGVEGYGIYALLTGLVGYYTLLDFGLGQGVTRFVAHYRALERKNAVAHAINSSMVFYLLIGIPAFSALIILRDPLLQLLNIAPSYWEAARIGLVASAVGFFFTLFTGVFSAALMGAQRYDLTSKVNVGSNLLLTAAIVITLAMDKGLVEVVLITSSFSIATSVVYLIVVLRVIPEWKLSAGYDLQMFRELFRFSGYLFVSRLSNVFHLYIVRFLVGAIVGPAAVTYYAVSLKLVGVIGGFLTNAFGVLFPFSSELHAQKKISELRQVYVTSSKFFCSIAIPLLITLALFAHLVLQVWIGSEFADEAWILLSLLAVSGLLSSLTTVPIHIVIGMGHSRIIGLFSVFTVVLIAALTPILTKQLGIIGTGIAMLVATVPGVILVAYQTKRILQIELGHYFQRVFGFHTPAVGLYVMAVYSASSIGVERPLVALLVGGLLLVVYFGVMHWLDWFSVKQIVQLYKGSRTLESSWGAS